MRRACVRSLMKTFGCVYTISICGMLVTSATKPTPQSQLKEGCSHTVLAQPDHQHRSHHIQTHTAQHTAMGDNRETVAQVCWRAVSRPAFLPPLPHIHEAQPLRLPTPSHHTASHLSPISCSVVFSLFALVWPGRPAFCCLSVQDAVRPPPHTHHPQTHAHLAPLPVALLLNQAVYGKSEDDLEVEEQRELKRLMKGVCQTHSLQGTAAAPAATESKTLLLLPPPLLLLLLLLLLPTGEAPNKAEAAREHDEAVRSDKVATQDAATHQQDNFEAVCGTAWQAAAAASFVVRESPDR